MTWENGCRTTAVQLRTAKTRKKTLKEQIDYKQLFNFTNAEDMRRNWQRTDQDWIQGNFSSVNE